MKVVFLMAVIMAMYTVHAQNFEGTITWSIKTELTDPQQKADMEKAQQKMADPANQEKMRKMQEQMNTPEMKAMMDANAQMKQRMEATMKAMQGGGPASMMPGTMIIKMKGGNSLSHVEGGMMNMETLYLMDKKQSYMINRDAKTYSVLNSSGDQQGHRDSAQRKVTKTGEHMTVLNYDCEKYVVDWTDQNNNSMSQVLWTTKEIKGIDMRSLARQRMNNGQSFYYEGIEGVPLRVEIKTKQANMVMEVTDIKRTPLPAEDFTIPAGFTETKGFGMQRP